MKHLKKEILSAYIDGELNDSSVVIHLNECAKCMDEYKSMVSVKSFLLKNDPAYGVQLPEMKTDLNLQRRGSTVSIFAFSFVLFLVFAASVTIGVAGGKRISSDNMKKSLLSRNEFKEMTYFYEKQELEKHIFGK